VRPMALSPDERYVYMQLSFLHGFVEFDLATDKPLRIAHLPLSEEARNSPREQYLLDSAHHGLAMNPEGTKLCAAGTMSDYAAIVDRATFDYKIFNVGHKPYWSTNSGDGRYCFVSVSGDDKVVVLDYASEQQVAEIPVGDHPQRMRMGLIRADDVGGLPGAAPAAARKARGPAKLRIMRARVRGGRLDMRLRMTGRATGRLRAVYLANGRRTRFRVKVRPRAWNVKRRLPAAQRRRKTGIVVLRYAGNRRVRPDLLRSRVANGKARLRRMRSAIESGGMLRVGGTISRRARGIVRVRMEYGDANVLRYRTRIRRGRWQLSEQLPSKAASEGGDLSIQYTGHLGRRIRGEQVTTRVRP
jgi:YVTN family beta-propeller protein